jgi:mannose-6-phosphate isomerase-like protein (cupin superfamily)
MSNPKINIDDIKDFVIDIETFTKENEYYRDVLYTSDHMQFVLMNIPAGEEIGMEKHNGDQFIRLEEGSAKLILGNRSYILSHDQGFIVPANTNHNVINITSKPLKIYTIYSPPQHGPTDFDVYKYD